MPSLKDLKNRISSVKATQKITKAMKMVAAARLRRAQEAVENARPYCERMNAAFVNIAAALDDGDEAPPLMAGTGRDDTHLLVVCTAERGLCGGFNSAIARHARDHARQLLAQGKTVKFFCIGKKGFDSLRREFAPMIVERMDLRSVKKVGFNDADAIAHKIAGLFDAGECDICTLFYARFQSVISQIPADVRLIPAAVPEAADKGGAAEIYEYEPDAAAILRDFIPRRIASQILQALLENAAGEMGARMSAMDNATRNAGDMIDKLTLSYNRQRQARITTELIEVISGAEAL